MYNKPIRFGTPIQNFMLSSKHVFSFSVTNVGLAPDPVSIGDGLTFVMAPHDHTLGRSGGFYVIIMVSRDL